MARKRQQYRPRRRLVRDAADPRQSQRALDDAARALLTRHDVAGLQALVQQSLETYRLADEEAQNQPSPYALNRYRSAAQALAEAERALALANGATDRARKGPEAP